MRQVAYQKKLLSRHARDQHIIGELAEQVQQIESERTKEQERARKVTEEGEKAQQQKAEQALKRKALKVVRKMISRLLAEIVDRWHDHAAQEKQLRAKLRKVMHRIANGALSQALER